YTGEDMVMDWPAAGKASHMTSHFFRCGTIDTTQGHPWYSNAYASDNFIDALVIGNRLSPNPCYLTRAKDLWSHATKWSFGTRYADDFHVGRYQNSLECTGYAQLLIYPNSGGDLTYTNLFFHDVNGASFDLEPPATVTDLGAASTQGVVAV